jgi:enoyl-CoA hydratase
LIQSKTIDGIAILTLSHGKANALDIEFCDALASNFAELANSDVKAVVLTGQGRIFSAGVDLKRLSQGGADYIRRFLPALHRLFEAVFFHPRPVVAAVNGHAIAGGCVLACCADRRIMARESGRIGVTEILLKSCGSPCRRAICRNSRSLARPTTPTKPCVADGSTNWLKAKISWKTRWQLRMSFA